jgi:hypothetical protein
MIETVDQQRSEDPNFSRGLLRWWVDDIHSSLRDRVAGHDGNERPGGEVLTYQTRGEISNPEPRKGCGHQSRSVVCLEASLGADCHNFIAVHEVPGLGPLHESLMGKEFIQCFRRAMGFDIGRTGDDGSRYRPDVACHEIGILKVAKAYCTIITIRDDIDDMITVVGMDFQLRMTPGHFREHGCKVGRAERKRRCDAQKTAKLAGGQDRFPGDVNFGTSSRCIVAERRTGLCKRSAPRRSCNELDTEFRFEPDELPAGHRLGDAEPQRSRRYPACIGYFHKCPEIFDVQFCVPHHATLFGIWQHYRITTGNDRVAPNTA